MHSAAFHDFRADLIKPKVSPKGLNAGQPCHPSDGGPRLVSRDSGRSRVAQRRPLGDGRMGEKHETETPVTRADTCMVNEQ